MARWILTTDLVIEYLRRGSDLLGPIPLSEIAVSALTFTYILAEIEYDRDLRPIERTRLRSSARRFREMLRAGGGEIPALSTEVIEAWGRVHILDLKHTDQRSGETIEMQTEDRLVVATALFSGYVYFTQVRDWNFVLERELQLALKII